MGFLPVGLWVARRRGGTLSDIPIIIDFTCQPLQNTNTALSVALTDYYHYFWNAMKSKKVADKDPTNTAAKKRYDAARKKFDEHHTILSEPSYWLQLFKEELNTKDGWPECDVAPTVLYPSSGSSSSDDEGLASPSRKRAREDLDVAVKRPVWKRYRLEDMPRNP